MVHIVGKMRLAIKFAARAINVRPTKRHKSTFALRASPEIDSRYSLIYNSDIASVSSRIG